MEAETFTNIFDALADTPAEVANLAARSDLLSAIRQQVTGWNVSLDAAAARLGLTRPRINDLMRGKIGKFSLDALVNIANAAGLALEIRTSQTPGKAAW